MTNIENFKTGIKKEGSTEVINLDPKINIANKKEIRILLKNIAESNLENINKNINDAYHDDAEIRAFHPLNDLKGVSEISEILWKPLINAFPDLERRDNLILGGAFQDKIFVSTIAHLTGTFVNLPLEAFVETDGDRGWSDELYENMEFEKADEWYGE